MPCQHLRLFSLANQNQAVISVAEKLGLYTHTHTVTALAFFSQLGAKKKDSKKESSKNTV